MKVSDLMQAMSDAGAPMAAILIAVRALEERECVIDQKRAVERDRKRLQRANERDSHGTVTGQSMDDTGTNGATPSLSRPPNENNSNPPTHTHPDTQSRARKGTRLSPDWAPQPLPDDLAETVAVWKPGRLESELARFRDWAASAPGQKGVKTDWQATWRNWIRRKIEEGPQNDRSNTNRNGYGQSPDRRSGLATAIDDGLAHIDAELARVRGAA